MIQTQGTKLPQILYLARGTHERYAVARSQVPPGLVTLDSDDPAEVFAKLPGADVVIVGTRKFDREMVAAAKRLRLVTHQGVGYHDTVDVEALRERGSPSPSPSLRTARRRPFRRTVILMLAACRRLSFADAELRQGRFHVNTLRLQSQSQTLAGKTIGFIGMGRIGQATARRLLGGEVSGLYADPVPLFGERGSALNLKRVDRDTLLRTANIVSLHVPLTDEARSMIDAAALATMKRGAVLVNTARGPVVDQAALVAALESGHLGAAGLDVYEQKPLRAGHALAHFPNVVLTPHIAAATRDTFAAKMQGVFANIGRFHAGTPMQDQVL